jgi:hypothetical protein
MLPKTTSGKVMIKRTRELYLAMQFLDIGGTAHE